ncbi:MAG: SPOR domain-containing protein [Salinibacter sp.]
MVLARSTLSVLAVLVLCACSGPSQSQPSSEAEDEQSEPSVTEAEDDRSVEREAVADFETFDPSAYPVDITNQTDGVSHRVPAQLLRGRADEGVQQSIEGYRVQVFSAQDQEAAQDVREEVRQWWDEEGDDAPEAVFRSSPPPIVVEYSQPYYRVRIGAFADRAEAEDALEFVQDAYDGAFIVRSTVKVVR